MIAGFTLFLDIPAFDSIFLSRFRSPSLGFFPCVRVFFPFHLLRVVFPYTHKKIVFIQVQVCAEKGPGVDAIKIAPDRPHNPVGQLGVLVMTSAVQQDWSRWCTICNLLAWTR